MATIKTELVKRESFKQRDDVRLAAFRYIECLVHLHRRHSALGCLSPPDYEKMLCENRIAVVAV